MHLMIKQKRNWNNRITFVLTALLVFASLSLGAADEADGNGDSTTMSTIKIIVNESKVIKTEFPTVRVAVTDPTVANVQILTPTEILVQGGDIGSTDLIIWSEDGKKSQQWKIQSKLDSESYQAILNKLFPLSSLTVTEAGKLLIVQGLLRSADDAVGLHNYLDKSGVAYVDMTSIAGVQQVQLEVRVAEVNRNIIRNLGINARYTGDDVFGEATISPSSGTPLISTDSDGVTTFSPAVSIWAGIPRTDLLLFFQALIENQYLKILANPTLVAQSGESASFLAGGEYPIPVVQSGGGSSTSISIEYREYGVRLKFEPVVLGDGTIRLNVAPEVSELTDVGAVNIEGFSIKALLVRKMATTLELKSGQTFAMAGLIRDKSESVRSDIPGLGSLPILGPLFRSVAYRNEETELIVLVTASLVEPLSMAQKPVMPGFLHKAPNDWELFIEGRMESETPAKIAPGDASWLKENGIDQLIGPGAWESHTQTFPAGDAVKSGDAAENYDSAGE